MIRGDRRALLAVLVGATLAGCAIGPDFRRPEAPQEQRYTRAPLQSERSDVHEGRQQVITGE